jgi:SagB-type dehydrogenase family enzyme
MGLITKYYCNVKSKSLVFYLPTGEFEITSYNKFFLEILNLCNGGLNYNEIIKKCEDFEELAIKLLNFLIDNELVTSLKHWSKIDYKYSNYPDLEIISNFNAENIHSLEFDSINTISVANNEISNFNSLVIKRKSTRDFVDIAIPFEKIKQLLWSMSKYTTSSAGGYYPYNIILCNHIETPELKQGWYHFIEKTSELKRLNVIYDDHYCERIHDDPFILQNATCTLYLVAQLESHCDKYTNRGIKFVFAEGGSLIQNAYLVAAEQEIGICALGGFDEKFLIKYLNLNKKWIIPFSLVLGTPSKDEKYCVSMNDLHEKVSNLESKLSKSNKLINTTNFVWNEYFTNTLVSTTSNFITGNTNQPESGYGTSNIRTISKLKSLVEVYERVVCSKPSYDIQSTAANLDVFINPNDIFCRNGNYIDEFELYDFNVNDVNLWVKGFDIHEKSNNYTLIDTLYYPDHHDYLKRRPYIFGSSNGAGGHYDQDLAKIGAFCELLERDALMVMWYAKKTVQQLDSYSLPRRLLEKIISYSELGIDIKIYDVSIDIPTFLVVFLNEKSQPHFTSGASSNLNSDVALLKAFEEAEVNYLSWSKFGKFENIELDSIFEPFHHHLYYCNKSNLTNLNWLFSSSTKKYENWKVDLNKLLNMYDPWFFHLQHELVPELYIYKCLSSNLAPIHFGFPAQFNISKRLDKLGFIENLENSNLPHFFS